MEEDTDTETDEPAVVVHDTLAENFVPECASFIEIGIIFINKKDNLF